MSVPPDADLNSNASDFDHSDEDIASLLADDDEDIFTKKTFTNSPSKKRTENLNISDPENSAKPLSSGTGIPRKDSKVELGKMDEQSISYKSSPKRALSKSQSIENDDPDSDALNDILSDSTLPSFLKKSSPVKGNLKIVSDAISDVTKNSEEDVLNSLEKDKKATPRKSKDSFYNSFFKNLSSPKGSPEKSSAASPLDKKVKQIVKGDDDDILKSLKHDEKIPTRKRSDSYFDSFLKNISPKTSPKKTLIENETRRKSVVETKDDTDDDDDDDLLKTLESDEEKSPQKRKDSYLGSFLKTSLSPKNSPKKSSSRNEEKRQNESNKLELEDNEEDIFGKSASLDAKKSNPASQKHSTPEKRKTFTKQVSFKGIPDSFPESPVKENTLFSPKRHPETPESEAKTKPTSQPRRSERMGASNKEETEWLSFFKETPSKINRPTEQTSHVNDNVPDDRPLDFKASANRRRSSSAEWLGLSESELAERESGVIPKGILSKGGDYLESKTTRPQSTPESSIKKKLLGDSQTDLSWLGNEKTALSGLNSNTVDTNEFLSEKEPFVNMVGGGGISNWSVVSEAGNLSNVVASSEVPRHFPNQEKKVHHTPFTTQNSPVDLDSQAIAKISSDVPAVRDFPTSVQAGQALHDPRSSTLSLQAVIDNHLLERDQLIKSSEALKQMYEERIKTTEGLHKKQLESSEESIKVLETKLKSELNSQLHSKEEKLNLLQSEKKEMEKNFRDKLEECEKQNVKEIERLKELHNQSIALMKQDHEDALLRLKRLKEQEIEAVLSTQTHSKSLQHLTEQLEARASELASLQGKVEERNQATLKEKQALLEAKERDLKNLQNRVERQLEEGDSERTRLQQLVLRLESRLQKYTAEGEEDRWEVQQMKARLSVQQKHLDEEYKLQLQQVEREKEKLRLSQDSLLHEQKTVLVQLAQERQQLMREKMDMESVTKKLKEEENVFHVKRMKEESFLESQKQFTQQEENRLRFEKSNVKQEAELVERERESLLRERQLLNEEKLKINEFNFKLKRKETEVEMIAMSAAEDRERAQVEHASAFKIKAEQQTRMQQIAQKIQEVMEKEQQILTEKEKLSEERLDLENKKKTILCNKCKLSLGLPVNAPPPSFGPVAISAPIANLPISNGVSNRIETFRPKDPSLVVWYITAERDREYLREEMAFLKSLKDSSTTRKQL